MEFRSFLSPCCLNCLLSQQDSPDKTDAAHHTMKNLKLVFAYFHLFLVPSGILAVCLLPAVVTFLVSYANQYEYPKNKAVLKLTCCLGIIPLLLGLAVWQFPL